MSRIQHATKPPKFPDRPPLRQRESVRSLIRLGRSHAITIPPGWIRRYVEPHRNFVIVTVNADGTLTVAALTTKTDARDSDDAPHGSDNRDRSA